MAVTPPLTDYYLAFKFFFKCFLFVATERCNHDKKTIIMNPHGQRWWGVS